MSASGVSGDPRRASNPRMLSEQDQCSCQGDPTRAVHDPAYKRALWIVVVLNLGFGVLEMIGGFAARSQALKADALDFIGDGSITFVGLLALGWPKDKRAQVALAQGWFLAALGIAVIGGAIWRAMNAISPEADLMGGFGVAGLGDERRRCAHTIALPRNR